MGTQLAALPIHQDNAIGLGSRPSDSDTAPTDVPAFFDCEAAGPTVPNRQRRRHINIRPLPTHGHCSTAVAALWKPVTISANVGLVKSHRCARTQLDRS